MKPRAALLVLALAASSFAWGQALDPPGRIARLSYVEGEVAFQAAQESVRSELPDRPLIAGDRLITERGGRAELALGTAAIRLDQHSELFIVDLDATTVRVQLSAGTASVVLRDLFEDESFEIDTPNSAIALQEPGEYRLEVSSDGATALTVRGGTAEVGTPGGQVRVADGQRVQFEGRDAFANLMAPPPEDAFDHWVRSREQQLADAESRYAERNGDEYEALDRYGEWYDEPSYGRVWVPSYAYGGRAPYGYGHWQRFGFGWSWIDSAPWGFFTFHHGRWAFLHHLSRWCWVPEPRIHDRHFARDTRPFGRPRGDTRPRDDRRDPPVRFRTRDEDVRRPVTATNVNPRQVDADRRLTFQRDDSVSVRPRRGEPATMRPSDRSAARAEASSRTATGISRTFGARYVP